MDCLVFGDVLEHLVDPWAVLARLARLVCDGGQILACIPNVQHYSVIVSLLRGKWDYQDEGLLDRTHLRFFTLVGHPGPVCKGRIAGLRDPAAVVARRRAGPLSAGHGTRA